MNTEFRLEFLTQNPIAELQFEPNCSCDVRKISVKRISHFSSFIDSIRDPLLASRKSIKKDFLSKIIFFIKVLLKRPDLFTPYKFFQKSYLITNPDGFHQHVLTSQNYWTSESLNVYGFHKPLDRHDHALSAVRNLKFTGYVFEPSNSKFREDSHKKKENNKEMVFQRSDIPQKYFVGEWHSTKFFEIAAGSTVNGTHALSPDSNLQYPCGSLSLQIEITPVVGDFHGSNLRLKRFAGRGILLAFSNNLYHFLCEGIQPLIYCLENHIQFESIVIHRNTPQNFISLLRKICPDKTFLLQDESEIFEFAQLLVARTSRTFASLDKAFTKNNSSDFSKSDEFKALVFCRRYFSEILPAKSSPPIISIRDRVESRGFLNAKFLSTLSKIAGFDFIDLKTTEFEILLYKLRSTEIFVCESGAGILNFLFLPEGAEFIEVTYGNGDSWAGVLDKFDIKYHSVQLSRIQYLAWGKWLDVYIFPTARILFLVRKIIFKKNFKPFT